MIVPPGTVVEHVYRPAAFADVHLLAAVAWPLAPATRPLFPGLC